MTRRPEIRTVAALAQALGDSKSTVERQLADGTLRGLGLIEQPRRGRIRRFDEASVLAIQTRGRLSRLRRVS